MKIFVDENIPSRTVEELRRLGHDVLDSESEWPGLLVVMRDAVQSVSRAE